MQTHPSDDVTSPTPPPTPTRRRSWRWVAVGAAAVVAIGGTTAGVEITGSPGQPETIVAAAKSCGAGWGSHRAGTMSFAVTNRSAATMDIQLTGTGTGRTYAEIPTLGPGTTVPLSVTLDPGTYTWQCASLDNYIVTSNPARVTGPQVADPTPYYVPVNPDDLTAAADNYRVAVMAGIDTLVKDTDQLTATVGQGNLAASEKAWLVAHLDYERLGAAYDTFGPFDDEINGRPNGLPSGVSDPGFTGFLRLEYGLWHGQSAATLVSVADQLDGYVHGLQASFPTQTILITDLPLRTHEILENALQFELTAETDQGSNTNLATLGANIQGTEMTLNAIAPLLQLRYPQLLASLRQGLSQVQQKVDAYQQPDGWWTPVQALTTAQREGLDGALSSLLEQLSEVPGDLRLFSVGAD